MKFTLAAATIFMLGFTQGLAAQECSPGPKCVAADQKAQRSMATWEQAAQSPSVHLSSYAAYCSNQAVVDVAKVCEKEFRASGNATCGGVAAAQARESAAAAQSALASAKASAASSNWKPNCATLK